MKKEMFCIIALLLLLTACVPEPEPLVLPERKESSANITQEIQQIEEQAKEEVREKLAAEQALKDQQKQEQQKIAEAPKQEPKLVVQQDIQQSSIELGLYPIYFMDGSEFKSSFVTIVGEEAPSSYVVAMGNLIARTPGSKPIGFSMLDSDISDITQYNAIIAGNACNNAAIAHMFSNPAPCESLALPSGKGLIRIYKSANGNVVLLAAGKTDALVVSALNAIGTDQFKTVTGSEICVQGASLVQC